MSKWTEGSVTSS